MTTEKRTTLGWLTSIAGLLLLIAAIVLMVDIKFWFLPIIFAVPGTILLVSGYYLRKPKITKGRVILGFLSVVTGLGVLVLWVLLLLQPQNGINALASAVLAIILLAIAYRLIKH